MASLAPVFFESASELRSWFERHSASEAELWVGFYKRGASRQGIAYPEAVDEALCIGWIDAVRKSLDPERYTIRFTHRKPNSIWSAVNLAKVEKLTAEGRMRPAGTKVFEARNPERAKKYSFEVEEVSLAPAYLRALKGNAAAWSGFQAQPPSYRRLVKHWVMRAVKEETRVRRLEALIGACAKGERLKQFSYSSKR